ncbi:MAG TPA: hypothetical protein PKD34_02735 [Candidatus Doudnabacteria bacterium]|nr:hypothetical protein [Candidatus Doudnabacteria bacterium]
MKNFLYKIFSSKLYSVVVTVFLILSIFSIIAQGRSHKFDELYSYLAVPQVELTNSLNFSNKIATGKLAGFVAFENIENQPKDLRQYMIIEPAEYIPELNRQYFTVQNVYAMRYLAPSYSEKSILNVKSEDQRVISMVDEEGNVYEINKSSGEVILIDVNGDITRLITNQSKFEDFIINWLK